MVREASGSEVVRPVPRGLRVHGPQEFGEDLYPVVTKAGQLSFANALGGLYKVCDVCK